MSEVKDLASMINVPQKTFDNELKGIDYLFNTPGGSSIADVKSANYAVAIKVNNSVRSLSSFITCTAFFLVLGVSAINFSSTTQPLEIFLLRLIT